MDGIEATSGIGRRGLLLAAAWSVPVVAAAVATPAFAASATVGGTLYIIGNAFGGDPGGVYLTGSNYNGFGASGPYPAGAISITIVLPDVEGISDTLVQSAPNWSAVRTGNVVVISNAVAFEADASTGDIGNVSILGPFPTGSPYTISVRPSGLNVVFNGNLSYVGEFRELPIGAG